MRWLIYAGLIIIAAIVFVVIVGSLLPKSHVATRKIKLHKTPAEIFALISGPSDWRPGVKYEALPDGKWRETGSNGSILYERVESKPSSRLITRIADSKLPFGGTWTYQLTPSNGETELRVTENGEVYNPVFRFVSRFIMGHTATIDKYLQDCASHFGEAAAITD